MFQSNLNTVGRFFGIICKYPSLPVWGFVRISRRDDLFVPIQLCQRTEPLTGEYQQSDDTFILSLGAIVSPNTDNCAVGNVKVENLDNRIVLTNMTTGESYQSYDTSSEYNQLPEALNMLTSGNHLEVLSESTSPYFGMAFQLLRSHCKHAPPTPHLIVLHLSSTLSGLYTAESDGGFILTTGCDIPDGACNCDGHILDECGVCGGLGIAPGSCDCSGTSLTNVVCVVVTTVLAAVAPTRLHAITARPLH